MIANQVLHRRLAVLELPGHLARLLGDPDVIRMRRASGEVHLTRTVLNEKQAVQGLQGKRFNGEEIAGKEPLLIVIEECTPGTILS